MADDIMIWELRNPDGGSMGLEFARGRMAPHTEVLSHAVPERVDVEVRDGDGRLVASGKDLHDPESTPISRLDIREGRVVRKNVWPGPEDIGKPVILPGGEVGILTSWWNADDHNAWRWTVELSNSR